MKLAFCLFSAMVLFAFQIGIETYCSINVQRWQKAVIILAPLVIVFPLFWLIWKTLYEITGSAWQSGIYVAPSVTLGAWIGTYFGSGGELPSKMQIVAIAIKLVAVFVSKL